ncbi:hypothetical protein Tsubulata_021775 [Turnera subulata]|uniref:Uncharacterized protein n=1 Tax=Turnera subulata TaxID=218843 RepID=A0A9Q0J527_9ROSI|nr:hypothetical protein Tsubulata_021775 [Turnera subulata]
MDNSSPLSDDHLPRETSTTTTAIITNLPDTTNCKSTADHHSSTITTANPNYTAAAATATATTTISDDTNMASPAMMAAASSGFVPYGVFHHQNIAGSLSSAAQSLSVNDLILNQHHQQLMSQFYHQNQNQNHHHYSLCDGMTTHQDPNDPVLHVGPGSPPAWNDDEYPASSIFDYGDHPFFDF